MMLKADWLPSRAISWAAAAATAGACCWMQPGAARAAQFETIFTFSDQGDSYPWGGVFAAKDGSLYATNDTGGSGDSGTLFRLSPPSGGGTLWRRDWTRSFSGGTDGDDPLDAPVVGPSGMAYGTTSEGGRSGTYGVAYEVKPGGPGSYRVIWNFTGGRDGGFPWAPLTPGPNGELYGTTTSASTGSGTVFRLQPPKAGSDVSTLNILHTFSGGNDGDASQSNGGLYRNAEGRLFGVTFNGGASGNGVIYELVPEAGNHWRFVLLHGFTGGVDGGNPECALVADRKGYLYGTTSTGGAHGGGTVFRLVGSGTSWTLQTLHAFGSTTSPQGATPFGNILVGLGGVLFGTTRDAGHNMNGVLYRLLPPSAGTPGWTYSVVHYFGFLSDGANPRGLLSLGPDGGVYGSTVGGGPGLGGTIFRYQP